MIEIKEINTASPKFIKLRAEHEDKIVDITLNTNIIESYVSHTVDGSDTKCLLNVSKWGGDKNPYETMNVLESKEYLDDLLT